MLWKTLVLAAAALLAAPLLASAATQKPAAPKPAAAKAAPAKSAPAKAPVADFDARNPASMVDLLNKGPGVKAAIAGKDDEGVLVTVASVAANFSLQFTACDRQGRACKAVLFEYADEKPGPTFAQINAFNQTSAACRVYEDKAGKPHLLYSMLLFADDPFDHIRTEFAAWTGCIGEFRNFLKDPNGYLAAAP